MTNKNKLKLLISSILIVLPSIVALILHELVEVKVRGAWHFTWILPVILVLVHVILHIVTFRENERVGQSGKIVEITYWTLPALSFYVSALFVMLSLGLENALAILFSVLFGTMFIIFGNYMPKSVRNRTFGMKIKWTLANDENWVATHRFAGKVWVITGIAVLICAFLPEKLSIILMLVAIIPAVIIPIIYSYCFYKKQLRQGKATKEDYPSYPKSKMDKKITFISVAIGAAILIGVAIIMFVGKITFTVGEGELEVGTTYGGGMTVDLADIDSVEYVEERVPGMRVSGFASAKLLYGWFKNDELGNYTRYTYAKGDYAVIIRAGDDVIVLADESAELTRALYDELAVKIGTENN